MTTSIVRFADQDGPEYDVFFVVPKFVNGEDAAKMVMGAYDTCVDADPDEWSWADVIKMLEPEGFTLVDMVTVGYA